MQVNGMDIIAVVHAVKYTRKWVTEGNGPILMEFVTYRYGGHSCVVSYMFSWDIFRPSCCLVTQDVRPRNYLPYA